MEVARKTDGGGDFVNVPKERRGGGYSYPPANCFFRNCSVCNPGCYPGINSGGGVQEFRLTSEMGADIHNLVRSLRALIEDVRITLGSDDQ